MTTTTSDWVSTNKLLMDICDFDKSLFDTSTLSTEEIRYYNSITRGFDKQIEFFIDWLDSDEAKRIFNENESYNQHVFDKIEDEIKNIVGDTSLTADEIITSIYDSGLQAGADEIRRTKYYNDATKFGLEFLQDYNFSLISNVNEDLKNHIRAEIFTGIAAAESMPEVANRILNATDNSLTGKTLSARQRAMMIARTETARAMTQGRLQSYANYGVQEVKILTAGDSSVCAICREAEAKIYPIEEAANLVPFHPLCRCSVMAYIRHGILQKFPDSDADAICCAPEMNTDEKDSFKKSAKEEFKDLSKIRHVDVTDNLGNKITFNIHCSENAHVDFYKKQLDDINEEFYRYDFMIGNDVKFTIFKSYNLKEKSVLEMLELYYSFPELLREECRNLVLSSQEYKNQNNKPVSGFVHFSMPETVYLMNTEKPQNMKGVLAHELAHSMDGGGFKYSNNDEEGGFIRAYNEDFNELYKLYGDNDDELYVSPYSQGFTKNALAGGYGNYRPYSEDFAECVRLFFTNRGFLRAWCPAKENYLSKLFNM